MDLDERRGAWLAPMGYVLATLGVLVALAMISLPFVFLWLITHGGGLGPAD